MRKAGVKGDYFINNKWQAPSKLPFELDPCSNTSGARATATPNWSSTPKRPRSPSPIPPYKKRSGATTSSRPRPPRTRPLPSATSSSSSRRFSKATIAPFLHTDKPAQEKVIQCTEGRRGRWAASPAELPSCSSKK